MEELNSCQEAASIHSATYSSAFRGGGEDHGPGRGEKSKTVPQQEYQLQGHPKREYVLLQTNEEAEKKQ